MPVRGSAGASPSIAFSAWEQQGRKVWLTRDEGCGEGSGSRGEEGGEQEEQWHPERGEKRQQWLERVRAEQTGLRVDELEKQVAAMAPHQGEGICRELLGYLWTREQLRSRVERLVGKLSQGGEGPPVQLHINAEPLGAVLASWEQNGRRLWLTSRCVDDSSSSKQQSQSGGGGSSKQGKTRPSERRASKAGKWEQAGLSYLRTETYSCGGQTHTVKEYRHDKTGLEFVLIPGGSFAMGSNDGDSDEKPVHEVRLSSFLLSKTAVTQAVWQRIRSNGVRHRSNGANLDIDFRQKSNCKVRTALEVNLPSCYRLAVKMAAWFDNKKDVS